MNSKRYSIGFLIVSLILFCLISGAYQYSYRRALKKAQKELAQQEEKLAQQESVAAGGDALKNDCYYLTEKNGYVAVCLSDKKTVYEYTTIEVADLPATLQNEIKNGKYIRDLEELYGFLENYSS